MKILSQSFLVLCSFTALGTASAGMLDREILCSIDKSESSLKHIRMISISGSGQGILQRDDANGVRNEDVTVSSLRDARGERFSWKHVQTSRAVDSRTPAEYMDALSADGISIAEAKELVKLRYEGSAAKSTEVILRKGRADAAGNSVWTLEREVITKVDPSVCEPHGCSESTFVEEAKVMHCSDSLDAKVAGSENGGRSEAEMEFDRLYHH